MPGQPKDWMQLLTDNDSDEELGKQRLIDQLNTDILEDSSAAKAAAPTIEDSEFLASEAEELSKIDVNWLAGMAAPEMFLYNFPPVLLAAWQLLTQSAVKIRDFSQIALGIPRGHGKTTLVKLFILWCILFSQKKFILIIASTEDLAVNILSDVSDMLDEQNIIRTFGSWRMDLSVEQQKLKKFSFRGRKITIAAIGAGGSLRGLNIRNERPDLMIFEDIQTKEDSKSQEVSKAIEEWMISTAMKAKSPHGCTFIFCGNMYPGPNSILKKLKGVKSWIKFIAGAILVDGTALWEELRPLSSLIAELENDIEMDHPEIFFSEVLNDTEAGINNRVDFSRIKEWPFQKFEQPQGKFIVIDPASGKKGGDDVSIGYFEIFDGIPGLRELEEDNFSPGNTIRRALLMALVHGCCVIAVESNSYQATLLYWFGVVADQLGITGIQFVEVHSGMNAKNSRIANMLKALTATEIRIHPDVRARVISQISNWNPLKRDNIDGILDLLTYAPKVIELYGPLCSTVADMSHLEAQAAHVEANNTPF